MMMTTTNLKRKATDIFSFILLSCPDFPPQTKTSVAHEFSELTDLIDTALERAQSEDSKQWLRVCLKEVAESRKHYEEGDRRKGMDLIQRAEEHFRNAFSRKQVGARFVVSEGGAAHDTDAGFPQKQ